MFKDIVMETTKVIHLEKANTLAQFLSGKEREELVSLKVTGFIGRDDFEDVLEDMCYVYGEYDDDDNFIPYEDLYNYFLYPMEVNGGNYGISAQAFGVFVAKLCRQKNNLDKEFRLSKNKLKNNTNYTSISIKTVPKYTSPYTAITSENWDESVVAALMNNNKVDVPLEKLMTK